MAKMVTAQITASMGGYSPQELHKMFGPEKMYVAMGTGLGDLKPFNRMTIDPVINSDKTANYLMASLLPDATAGQVATEQLGALGMALCVVAACSTGNADYIMAQRDLFARYYLATKRLGTVDWSEVFARMWVAGGVDYALTFNSVFGFNYSPSPAIIMDDWRKARDLVLKHISRPDDLERMGFVLGAGGGALGVSSVHHARENGLPVYSVALGTAFRTDGFQKGKAREGYGRGQRDALFEAWEEAKTHLTEQRAPLKTIEKKIIGWLGGQVTLPEGVAKKKIGELGLRRSQITAVLNAIKKEYGLDIEWNKVKDHSVDEFSENVWWHSRTLKKKVVFVVVGHKTSTPAGDPYEEESLRRFLSTILPEGEMAHLSTSKAFLGHLLGGSSGADSALTQLILNFHGVPGNPGLDNLSSEQAKNSYLFHHKEAINLNDLYDPDTIFVAIREAAGFNAKNTAIFEVKGKLLMKNEGAAHHYVKLLVENAARERIQKRAERNGLRKMVSNFDTYKNTPVDQYEDLYALYLRSDAIATALLSGKKFNFDQIGDWIYQFPVNKDHRNLLDQSALELGDQEEKIAQATAVADLLNGQITAAKEKAAAGDTAAQASVAELEGKLTEATTKKDELEAETLNRANLNRHNAIKYAEAYDQIRDILASFDRGEIEELGREARAKGWDKQPVVFYGMSDGMGLRTLLGLIVSGAVKEVIGLHLDDAINKPEKRAGKISAFTPQILREIAKAHGVNLQVFNQTGINYVIRDNTEKKEFAGQKIPLQQNIIEAVEAARKRCGALGGGSGDILFWNYVAFGAPWRRVGDPEMFVPNISESGKLSWKKVSTAKNEEDAQNVTINPMGKAHGLLLRYFLEQGWLGARSETFAADWWGSEAKDVLFGVYGGAILGDAKIAQKMDLDEIQVLIEKLGAHLIAVFADNQPIEDVKAFRLAAAKRLLAGDSLDTPDLDSSLETLIRDSDEARAHFALMLSQAFERRISWQDISSFTVKELSQFLAGRHGYIGYPAFLSFALHQIPGGTLTGIVGKKIYADIQAGRDVEGFDRSQFTGDQLEKIRFYTTEELSLKASVKAARGEYSKGYGGKKNKISVDDAEKLVAKAIDARFKKIGAAVEAAVTAKTLAAVTKEVNEDESIPADKKEAAIAKALPLAISKMELSTEESYAILRDYVTEDYLDYCFQHIQKPKQRLLAMRGLKQDRQGIEALPLPRALQTQYPFFQRAIAGAANTPELAIAVIDARGVGTLFAGQLSPEDLDKQITTVKKAVGNDSPLIVNILLSDDPKRREALIEAVIKNKPAAVSFGNGIVSKEVVAKLRQAGITTIQLTGTERSVSAIMASGVDLVIAERNLGPGHIANDEGSAPETLVKHLRQALYDAGIPVIAGGGFIDAEDVVEAKHWGASAVQLDDAIAYAGESSYAAKALVEAGGLGVMELFDADDKPVRVLKTTGAEKLAGKLELLRDKKLPKETMKPLIARLFLQAFQWADGGDVDAGLFLAGAKIGQVKVGETLEDIFRRLNGEDMGGGSDGDGGGSSGGGGGRGRPVSAPAAAPAVLTAPSSPAAAGDRPVEHAFRSDVITMGGGQAASDDVLTMGAAFFASDGNAAVDLSMAPDLLTKASPEPQTANSDRERSSRRAGRAHDWLGASLLRQRAVAGRRTLTGRQLGVVRGGVK
ncbi:MAG: nitronate monooxygenase [Deltaproteobacteria bacterium]|nr:nitronate monooxygenase [Deltaproteobacteria bacterium]